jgi:Flp pilus assembly pilin Flp
MREEEGLTQRKKTRRERSGQTLAEYALILMLIALVCIGAVTLLGIPIRSFYTSFNGSF